MKLTFPKIGARIIKSSIAVGICMTVYWIRTILPVENGIPFYGALAALWCIQPYNDTTKNNALQRSAGTLIGACYGLLFLLMFRNLGLTIPELIYISSCIVIIPVIYTTVVINRRNASFFSCVVFLSIELTHSFDENPYIFVLNRVVDTFIGIIIGIAVNDFHLPVKHDDFILYVSGIDDVLVSPSSNYSKVELNRLIRSGMKFTISTTRTPAELISIMNGTDLQLPVIVMDGAAIYDIKEKKFLEMNFLSKNVSDTTEKIIRESGLHYFVNVMLDSTLLIYYGEFQNQAEKELFKSHKNSPYRNYISADYRYKDINEQILYYTVLAEKIDIFLLERKLRERLGVSARICISDSEYDGFMYLKVFSPHASKQNMITKLKKYAHADKVITFGSIRGKYDIYINDGGGNKTVKIIKKICRAHGKY